MSISSLFDRLHAQAKSSLWLWLFSIFCRVSLAYAFILAGLVKIIGERFASGLAVKHPMGAYLEALHHTGYYYTFIGWAQIAAAVMLLIPRTVTLGAFLYFPIILNITILTYATRFDGSLFTSPLMTLANLFLLGWNYEKWKHILPFNQKPNQSAPIENQTPETFEHETADRRGFFARYGIRPLFARFRAFLKQLFSQRFPTLFFAGVFAAVVIFVLVIPNLYAVKPRNKIADCQKQFKDTNRTAAGDRFCQCIHTDGSPLAACLSEYENSPDDAN